MNASLHEIYKKISRQTWS
ncbi:hypothetical protein [Polynucleobacter rarus]